MVNKGRIHMEIRKLTVTSSNLIQSDDEWMIEIGENVDYESKLQNVSKESKIIEFDFNFAEKLKIEVGDDFQKLESQI